MTRYFGNVKVQVYKNYRRSVTDYLNVVPLNFNDSRELLVDVARNRVRPIVADQADFEMAMRLRLPAAPDPGFYMPDNATRWSKDLFEVFLFLTRFGKADRSYVPVAKEGVTTATSTPRSPQACSRERRPR